MKSQSPRPDRALLRDNQTLVGAKTRFGYDIKVYDDGFGQLFISRNSIGINGIVRAQTWEDAYEICEDEFFPTTTDTLEQMLSDFECATPEELFENAAWNETYGFRPNGGEIYDKDLNGDYLDVLTPELMAELEITLTIECHENEEVLV